VINDDSTVAFVARNVATGAGVTAGAVHPAYTGTTISVLYQKKLGHGLDALVKSGDPAPGGGVFIDFYDISQNNDDWVAFIGIYTDGEGNHHSGVFLKPYDDSVRAIAREGQVLPGTGGGVLCVLPTGDDSVDGPWLNNSDAVAFKASCISGGKGNGALSGSIFIKEAGESIEPLVKVGDAVPGTGGGTITDVHIGNPGLNENLVGVLLSLTGGNTETVLATQQLEGDDLTICARQGTTTPVLGGPLSFNGAPAIAGDGTLGTSATGGPSDNLDGIFTCRDGKLKARALQNDPKPVGKGNTFGSLEETSLSSNYIVFLDEGNGPTGVFRASLS